MKKLILLSFQVSTILIIFSALLVPRSLKGQDFAKDSIGSKEDLFKFYIDLGEKYWRTDKKKTDSLARLGLKIAQDTIISDSLWAEGYHLLGKTLIDVGYHQAGIDTLLKCIEIKERAYGKNRIRSSRTYNYIGLGYLYSNDFANAQIYFGKAIKVIRYNKVFLPELFDTYMNLGILRSSSGEYSKAYYHYGRAKMVLDSLGPRTDSIWVAQFYFNYGDLATTLGKFKEAQKYFNMSESIFLRKFGPKYDWLASINVSKGKNEFYNENYHKAILLYKKSLDIYLYHNRIKAGIPVAYYYLGRTLFKLNDFQGAIAYCQKGLEYDPAPTNRLALLIIIASSYAKLPDLVKADHFFKLALEKADNKEIEINISAFVHLKYAEFLFANHQYEKSKTQFEIARKKGIQGQGESSTINGLILSHLGNYHLVFSGDLQKALDYFEESCAFWNRFFKVEENTLSPLFPNEIDFLSAYRGKAQTLYQFYIKTNNREYLDESLRFYQIALNKAELVNKNLDKENNYLLLEKIEPVYEEAIVVANEIFKLKQDTASFVAAFELAEMSKASVLLNSIQNNYALRTAEVPEDIVEFEFRLRTEINGLKKLRAEEDSENNESSKKITFFNSQLLELMVTHDSLKEEIEQNYPRYYQLKFDRTIINLDTLQSNLNETDAIVEYALSDSALFLFLITRDTFDLQKINIDEQFYRSLNHLINVKDADIGTIGEDNISDYVFHAGFLWECLIEPVYKNISGKHLIVIPDGPLGYLPFEILLNADAAGEVKYFNELPYMLKEFPISYAHSSTLKYNTFFDNDQKASNGVVSFSPSYDQSKYRGDRRDYRLSDLPNSDEEAKAVRKIFGGKAYRNSKATKSRFVEESGNYQLIHLAMHALINDSLPLLSELIFAQEGKKDTSTNILHTYEVFGLELQADMVTLSACNTGTGKLQKGEGIMSLARGFIYAGVPAVVMTLWEVQDKSGYDIMRSFYQYLKAGDSKDIALQKAKIDFLEKANMFKSHPYFWSSYILSGDSSTIDIIEKEQESDYLLTIAVIAVILLLLIFLKIKKRKNRVTVPAP